MQGNGVLTLPSAKRIAEDAKSSADSVAAELERLVRALRNIIE
jgi:hypothetical protein